MAKIRLEGPIVDDNLANKILTRFMQLMAVRMTRAVIPRMQQVSPVDTGTLQRAIYLSLDVPRLVLTIGIRREASYWRYQPGLLTKYRAILYPAVRRLAQPTFNQALADVL